MGGRKKGEKKSENKKEGREPSRPSKKKTLNHWAKKKKSPGWDTVEGKKIGKRRREGGNGSLV